MLISCPLRFSLVQQPQAKNYAYESKSGVVVDLLNKLGAEFQQSLADTNQAEARRVADHNTQMASTSQLLKEAETVKAESTEREANAQQAGSEAAARVSIRLLV